MMDQVRNWSRPAPAASGSCRVQKVHCRLGLVGAQKLRTLQKTLIPAGRLDPITAIMDHMHCICREQCRPTYPMPGLEKTRSPMPAPRWSGQGIMLVKIPKIESSPPLEKGPSFLQRAKVEPPTDFDANRTYRQPNFILFTAPANLCPES
jgi:hypothetical protein